MKILSADIPFDPQGNPLFAQLCDSTKNLHAWWKTVFFHTPKSDKRRWATATYQECGLEWCSDHNNLPRPDVMTTAGVDWVLNAKAYQALRHLLSDTGDFYAAHIGDGEKIYLYLCWESLSLETVKKGVPHVFHVDHQSMIDHRDIPNGTLFVSDHFRATIAENGITGLLVKEIIV